ncbi:hypothetical protein HGM15179_019843 [Zosterops borbonicus]|uniref:Endonuclease/exonuclease/phosphatase domain-containing protein n=1 Tax=Zosterops borbonicus TaxID=364589 RepID=A0A8K1DAQ6_9PASS|nr:hypothetical protein HGM15179_019843 [Zosterops borbonicus]
MKAFVYQNRLALDYLLAEEEGVCGRFNKSECCIEIDDYGETIKGLAQEIKRWPMCRSRNGIQSSKLHEKCKRRTYENNYADTKISEEGGRGGAPGTRAKIPLQPVVKTMVKQTVPLYPMEIHEDAKIHLQPMEETHAGAVAKVHCDSSDSTGDYGLALPIVCLLNSPVPVYCIPYCILSIDTPWYLIAVAKPDGSAKASALVLVGDFNLLDVCWKYNTVDRRQSRTFLECVEENFLTQPVSEPMRGSTTLDLLFTNREGLVEDVVRGCLGHSNHKMIEFSVLGEVRKGVNKTSTLDFWRMDFGLFRTLVQRLPWETVLNNKEVQEGWTYFKKEILKATSMGQKMSPGGRLDWMNRELLLDLRGEKKTVYDLWKKGQATQEEYKAVIVM